MTRHGAVWRKVAGVFTIGNVAGLGMAAAAGEGIHGAVHVILALLGAAAFWWLSPRESPANDPATVELSDARLEQLQQSIDAIAIEVERIGEAQRFHTRLQTERSERAN